MTVAGIDLSSKAVDIVLLDEDTDAAVWHRFVLHGQDAFDRARSVRAAMPSRSWWEDQGVLAVGIEEPRGYSAGAIYRVQGAILSCLPASLLVQPWVPSEWRKAVGLKGNCSKDAIWAFAVEQGFEPLIPGEDLPFDATDAYCIALATREAIAREEAA